MNDLTAFGQAQKTIDRAVRARTNAHAAQNRFFRSDNVSFVGEQDAATGQRIVKVRFHSAFPVEIEDGLTVALTESRHAFDQALTAACQAIGRPLKGGKFYPWASNPKDLRRRLKHKKTGEELIPKEFWSVLRRQQPYPRWDPNGQGDTLIRTLATFANRKHTIGFSVDCRVTSFEMSMFARQAYDFNLPLEWDGERDEIIFATYWGDVEFGDKQSLTTNVVFDNGAPEMLGGTPAAALIEVFTDRAQLVLDELKQRTAHIIAARR